MREREREREGKPEKERELKYHRRSPCNGQANGPKPSGQGVHGALHHRASHQGAERAGARPGEDEEHQAQQ